MHRSRLAQIVIDCQGQDLDTAATFWAAALGHEAQRLEDPEDSNYRQLSTREGELLILVQSVDHASRVHLDIETDDVEAEAARLERLGAVRVAKVRTWWVMQAPTGQRFCVLRPQTKDLQRSGKVWE